MILIKKKIIAGHLNANSNFRELSTELKDKSWKLQGYLMCDKVCLAAKYV